MRQAVKRVGSWQWLGVMLVGFGLLMPAVQAVEVGDLSTGVVPVPDQSEAARQDGIVAAFQQVVLKRTANPATLSVPVIAETAGKAASLVQRYQFQLTPVLADAPAGSREQLLLQVSFDAKAIEQMLHSAAVPVWGTRRPLIVSWLAFQDQSGKRLVSRDDTPTLAQEWQQSARNHGLPVVLPTLDLEETSQIEVNDVWNRTVQPMLPFSARYGAEAMLVGRIEQGPVESVAELSFQHGNLYTNLLARAGTVNEAVQQVQAKLAEFLAGKYAVLIDPSKEAEVLVQVHQVRSVEAYGQINQLFSSMQVVRHVDVREVHDGSLLLSLRLIADQSALLQTIAMDGRLRVIESNEPLAALQFDWAP